MNKLYTTLFLLTGSIFTSYTNAQNVRAVQTSTNPQSRPVNNSPVIVIPKNEGGNVNQSQQRNTQKENTPPAVRKVEGQNQQGNRNKVNKRGR